MIVIKQSLWRSDCIAHMDLSDTTIQILPIGSDEYIEFYFEDKEEAVMVYKEIGLKWIQECREKGVII